MKQIDRIDSWIITNVDIKSGIMRSGNSKELYLEILEAFIEDSLERVNELVSCFEANNLDSYSIHAHGIKSALYLIGADDMSQKALELEMAASDGDMERITASHDEFINSLLKIRDKVVSFFNEPEPETSVSYEG